MLLRFAILMATAGFQKEVWAFSNEGYFPRPQSIHKLSRTVYESAPSFVLKLVTVYELTSAKLDLIHSKPQSTVYM